MHPSTSLKKKKTSSQPYSADRVDFARLAQKDPEFAAFYDGSFDFQNPKAVQQLTKSLLKADFGITVQLPNDRLCPPVPVRWNYIKWIQQLLDTTSQTYHEEYDQTRQAAGLDIGVGASCIYPLLACATRPQWRMTGIDVDATSFKCAQTNVNTNEYTDRIHLTLTNVGDPLPPLDKLKIERLDFIMTNPPFYSSREEMDTSLTTKAAPPSAVCTGADVEMICPGGDLGFVSRILDESLVQRTRVQWYTVMIGKLSSLHQFVAQLKASEITNYAITSLHAGTRTKRWAVAWSFDDLRPANEVARSGDVVASILPHATATTIAVPLMDVKWASERVNESIQRLDVKWEWQAEAASGVLSTPSNVWSRAARRKRKRDELDDANPEIPAVNADAEPPGVALAVRVTCDEQKVEVRWLRGHDHILYQSFCGWLKRSLNERPEASTKA